MFKETFFCLALLAAPFDLMKEYFDYVDKPLPPEISNDFIYEEGSTQVTSQISEYENIVAGKPIQGSIFVTHDAKNKVDVSSFRIGNKPLKVTFVQTSQMSSSSNIVVTIYSFQLEGLPAGTHTLPPIRVKVADKEVQAAPLVIVVPH